MRNYPCDGVLKTPSRYKHPTSFDCYKYEDLKADLGLFLQLCKTYQLEPLNNIQELYSQPSSKTHPKSSIVTGKKEAQPFSAEEYATINTYLDLFKIKQYKRKHSV